MCRNILARFGCWLAADKDERSGFSAVKQFICFAAIITTGYIMVAVIGSVL